MFLLDTADANDIVPPPPPPTYIYDCSYFSRKTKEMCKNWEKILPMIFQ